MAKGVKAIINNKGEVAISFEGFDGDSCYDEAGKIKARLQYLGVAIEVGSIIPHDEIREHIELKTGGAINENRRR